MFKLSLFLFLVVLFSCNKNLSCGNDSIPQDHPFIFEVKKNNQFIIDSNVLSSIKISYYEANIKKYMPDLVVSDTIMADTIVNRVISSSFIGAVSANEGINFFYIEYPANIGKTDTLYLDYLPPSSSTHCQYFLNQIKINNQQPLINSSISVPDPSVFIYIFSK